MATLYAVFACIYQKFPRAEWIKAMSLDPRVLTLKYGLYYINCDICFVERIEMDVFYPVIN